MTITIENLIDQWERFREQGKLISAEQLCKDSPELLDEVRWQIQALQAVGSAFGMTKVANTTSHEETESESRSERLSTLLRIPTEYRLERHHASGGLGDVFVGTDTKIGRRVAIKFPRARTQSTEQLRRFEREALITGRLDHPGIVAVHALKKDDQDHPCYVMRFVDGPTLQQRIAEFNEKYRDDQVGDKYRSLEFRQLLQAMIAVCNIAAYAHGQQVVHRDIKPANIILGPFGETFLLDWGLAKVIGESEESTSPDSSLPLSQEMTKSGQTMGTPEFASPEQLLGQVDLVDQRSDIFSLGASFYYLLTGQFPLHRVSLSEYLKRISSETQSLVDLPPQVPKPLMAICRAATHISPDLRYPSALEMARDIQCYLAQEPVSVMQESLITRSLRWFRKHRATTASGAVALFLILISSVVGLTILSRLNSRLEETNIELTVSNDNLELANTAEQKARAESEAYFESAAAAVDQYLVEITDNEQLRQTDFSELRRDLLNSSRPFLEKLRDQRPGNLKVEATRVKALSNLASIDQETGKLDDAETGYSLCITTLKPIVANDPSNVETRRLLAECYSRLGWINASKSQHDAAQENYHESISRLRQLSNESPDNAKLASYLAAAHVSLGNLFRNQQEFDSARDHYREAIIITNRMDERFPDQPECASTRASAFEHLGLMLARTGDRSQSLEKRLEALAVRETLAKRFPEKIQYRAKLALNLLNVGVLLVESDKPAEGQKHYLVALEILQQLHRDFPSNPIYSVHLAKVFNNLGNALGAQGQISEGLRYHEQALAVNEQLCQRYPKNFDYIVGLGGSYSNVGYFLRNSSADRALPWFDKAVAKLDEAEAIDSKDYTVRSFFRNTLDARATAHNALGRFSEAANDWKRAATYDDSGRAKPLLLGNAAKADSLAMLAPKFELALVNEIELDVSERINFAQFCHSRKLYDRAAKEYSIAFQSQPDALREYAYNAACSAALALLANPNSSIETNANQATSLNELVLDLLKTDLTRIKAGTAADRRILQHWLVDPDLEAVRDSQHLTSLSEQDQASWRELWAQVRQLVDE